MKGNKLKKMLTPGFQLIKAICCFLISSNFCVCMCVCVCVEFMIQLKKIENSSTQRLLNDND